MSSAEHFYPVDHPAAEGHFPGNPIIPGALLLADTLRAIAVAHGAALALSGIKAAKFHAPARPGDRVLIEFAMSASGRLGFSCLVDGATVLTGEAICDAKSTAN